MPLLSAVDTALMGHVSTLHLGAIGLSTMIFNFLYWNFGFLRMGTTGMVAQAYGAQDEELMRQLLHKSLLLAGAISGLLVILGPWLLQASVVMLDISDLQVPLVERYYNIMIIGAPAILGSFCLMGWLFGMQNAMVPLLVTVIINVFNAGLSYYFVVHQDLGIAGVAYGTLVSQYLGFVLLIGLIIKRYRFTIKTFSLSDTEWKAFAKINGDLFVRTIALTIAFGFFYRQSSGSGSLILAANVVLLQFLSWMSYGIDGFAYAAESLVGRFKGAGDSERLLRYIRGSFLWGGALALGYSMIFYWGFDVIVELFSNQGDVLRVVSEYRVWIALLPLGAFVCYIWDGIYIGLTATRWMRKSMLVSLLFYFLGFYILREYSVNAIWISFAVFLVLRGVIQTYYWISGRVGRGVIA